MSIPGNLAHYFLPKCKKVLELLRGRCTGFLVLFLSHDQGSLEIMPHIYIKHIDEKTFLF